MPGPSWGQGKQSPDLTLEEFTKDFFIPGKCKWLKRKEAMDRAIGMTARKFYRVTLEKRIIPGLGHLPLKSINPVRIENWLESFSLAKGTKNNLKKPLKHIFNEALREGLIDSSPLTSIKALPSKPEKERSVLSEEEINLLFPEDKDRLMEIWEAEKWVVLSYLVLTTGMRSGEVRALKWKDINFKKRIVVVNKAVKIDMTIGPPKVKYSRAAFLPQRTVKMLEAYRQNVERSGDEDWVFQARRKQQPLNGITPLQYYRKALDKAGIKTEGRVLDYHALRHTYNTIMRPVIPEALVRLQIGHKNGAMTEYYDHATPLQRLKTFKEERQKINKAFL